jgi:Cu-Zn family superoxide dismutase
MLRFHLFGAILAVAALGACSDTPQPRVSGAWADMINTSGFKIGEAEFVEREDQPGVVMRLRAWNLTPGAHGMHIHETGACGTPDFDLAGGHFNPFGKRHGFKNPEGPHAGDLPNLIVPENGRVNITLGIPGVTLKEGKNSLLQREGTSLVIHADADDGISDPAGNSGPRVACGVIRNLQPPELETR